MINTVPTIESISQIKYCPFCNGSLTKQDYYHETLIFCSSHNRNHDWTLLLLEDKKHFHENFNLIDSNFESKFESTINQTYILNTEIPKSYYIKDYIPINSNWEIYIKNYIMLL